VERLEKVRIGGIDQWVSVRGTDRRNPVLLYTHGGPGYVSIPMSWWFARGLEEYFTIVQWDQRATGKTYLLTDPATIAPTLSPERMIADTEEMARMGPEGVRQGQNIRPRP
jgi:proline iminopeptidase